MAESSRGTFMKYSDEEQKGKVSDLETVSNLVTTGVNILEITVLITARYATEREAVSGWYVNLHGWSVRSWSSSSSQTRPSHNESICLFQSRELQIAKK